MPESTTTSRLTPQRSAALRGEPALPAIAPTDGELLTLFVAGANGKLGDDASFARLVDRHGPMVWRVCRQVLARRQDAEDAFQVTFLLLARQARSVRASESAAGWLYRVAHRTALAARRKSHRRTERPLDGEPISPPEVEFPDLAQREAAEVMMEELRQLPGKYQAPLVLRYIEGRSRREIAEQTDSTVAAVQGQLARGKKLLRGRLLRRGVSLSAAMALVAGGSAAAEAAPLRVLSQTTANATAVATGGTLSASAVVVTLFREGVRAMFLSKSAKPAAALVVVLLLTLGGALGRLDAEGAAPTGVPLVLQTTPVEEAPVGEALSPSLQGRPHKTGQSQAQPRKLPRKYL